MLPSKASKASQRLLLLKNHIAKISESYASTASPQIEVSPTKSFVDEKVKVTIHGLNRGQKVTLQTCQKEGDKTFGACGHYIADSAGRVNTFTDMCHGGTFQDVEPMGLIWSMKQTPGVKPSRLIPTDVTVPSDVTVAVHDSFRSFEDLPWSETLPSLASCSLQRSYMAPGVRRIPVSEGGLYGTLFLPPGEGMFPGVFHLFGMTGGILEHRSAIMASKGYAAFTLGYVNHKDLPKTEREIDFNYFLRGFDWFASHPSVDTTAIGGSGTCVGGGYILFVAAMRPAMKCVVALNGSTILLGQTQTVEGEEFEAIPFAYERAKIVEGAACFKDMFSLDDIPTLPPFWRHGTKLLSIHGLDDQCVQPLTQELVKISVPDSLKDNCTYLSYPGTGHILDVPYIPLSRSTYSATFNLSMLWGGQPKPHADAQEDSWPKILAFFDHHLKRSQHKAEAMHT